MIQIDILLQIKFMRESTMGMMQELIHYFYQKDLIRHSKVKNIFTKYGIFQAKIYKDGHHEYLVIMSRSHTDIKNPIVYIYNESHVCDIVDGDICYCNHQMDVALKMLQIEGGIIIYYSADVRNIDGLLLEINARKLEAKDDVMTKTKIKSDLKMKQREYQAIGFIFEDLNLSRMKLITQDTNVVHVSQKLDIEITKRVFSITFDYGDKGK